MVCHLIHQTVTECTLGNLFIVFSLSLSIFTLGTASEIPLNLGELARRQLSDEISTPSLFDYRLTPTSSLPLKVLGDAPWTQAEKSYQSAISCPFGIQNLSRGIVFLVHGSNARESFLSCAIQSPYYELLPSHGFDLCWVDLPNHSLSDMQLSAEFVAYGIKYLGQKSVATGGKINVVSHSQGDANVQWASIRSKVFLLHFSDQADESQYSAFWPSIRKHVMGHIALSPSMKGTSVPILICPTLGGCLPSILQQTTDSNYMRAANNLKDRASATYALIPTTVVFTYTDEVVTPQIGPRASCRLIGASNIGLQDICGPGYVADHSSMVLDLTAYGIALDSFLGGRPIQASAVDRSYCAKNVQTTSKSLSPGNLVNAFKDASRVFQGDSRLQMIVKEYLTLSLPQEPPLQQYVCDRGYSTSPCTSNKFEDTD